MPHVTGGRALTLCPLFQLKLEDRSVVPRDVVRHMRSTVSPHPMGLVLIYFYSLC